MSFEYQEQYRYLSNACLNLTDACNLACRYCFVEQHPHYMSIETAKQAVDFLLSNLQYKKEQGWLPKDTKANISYFGGEPTLLWNEIIVPLTFYLEETYPNEFNLNITTNGTLLDKERIDFLYNHKINPLLSIDGAKDTQDANRPCQTGQSSFDLVYKNIPYLLEKFPKITFRATIDQYTADRTFENFLFAHYLGFQNIFMMPNCREAWSQEAKNILKENLEKIYQFCANCFINGHKPIHFVPMVDSFKQVLQHDTEVLKQNKTELNISRSPQRCGMGTGYGSIGFDGKIYGCQEQNSKDLKNIFYIGDIYNGIDTQKHMALLEKYTQQAIAQCENKSLCTNCKLRNICTGFSCPSSSWDLYESFFIDSEIHCLWYQWLFDDAIVLMHYFKENYNSLFDEYLTYQCNFKTVFPTKEGD